MGWALHVAHGVGDKILVGKHEGKRQLESPRHKWENDIKVVMKQGYGKRALHYSGSGQGKLAGFGEYRN
jgi:hypothetical protein